MTISHRTELGTVTLDDIGAEARRWRLGPSAAAHTGTEVAQRLLEAVKGLPALPEDRSEAVAARCRGLLATLS